MLAGLPHEQGLVCGEGGVRNGLQLGIIAKAFYVSHHRVDVRIRQEVFEHAFDVNVGRVAGMDEVAEVDSFLVCHCE